jgi:hypothetical protein
MAARTILLTGECWRCVFCSPSALLGVLSGLKVAQQSIASKPAPSANRQIPSMPDNLLRDFQIFPISTL